MPTSLPLTDPIAGLPDNTFLPADVHELADKWRDLYARLGDAQAAQNKTRAAIETAAHKDAEAIKAAIVADEPLPDPAKHERAARTAHADAARRVPVLHKELGSVGSALATKLHQPENRAYLVDKIRSSITPALAKYRDALDATRAQVSDAVAEVTPLMSTLALLEGVDSGNRIELRDRGVAAPDYGAAYAAIAGIQRELDRMEEPTGRPRERYVLLSNGRRQRMFAEHMHSVLRGPNVKEKLDVVEWLDGFGPEPGFVTEDSAA